MRQYPPVTALRPPIEDTIRRIELRRIDHCRTIARVVQVPHRLKQEDKMPYRLSYRRAFDEHRPMFVRFRSLM